MVTRELGMVDRDAALSLWERTGLTRPWNDPVTDFERAVAGPASAVLGGFIGDELMATAMVGYDGHRGWVYYLAVAEHRRRSGHARSLMALCEDWLSARSILKLNLMVRTSNEAVAAFYDALGYETDSVVVRSKRLA
jgi:ribosomal protein S18 acetylase RimI-like enzyme